MQTIEINKGIKVGFEEIIKGVQQLDNQSLTTFANEINRLVSTRKHLKSDKREVDLLKKIKTAIPVSVKQRQKQLFARLQEDIISPPERDELILLNNLIEEKTAERIVLIGELAAQRHVSVQELCEQLSIKAVL
jgi:hypothetical protein